MRQHGVTVRPPSFGDTAALTVASVLAATLALVALGYLLIPKVDLPAPFPDQHQRAENIAFFAAFAVFLPLAVWQMPRLAERIAGQSREALSSVAALSCCALAGLLLVVKVSDRLPWGGGLGTLLVATLVWWAFFGALVAWATDGSGSRPLAFLAVHRLELWSIVAVLLLALAFSLASLDSISLGTLGITLMLGALGLLLYRQTDLPAPGRWAPAIDVAAVLLLLLVVPNLVIVAPEIPAEGFKTQVIQFHQDFFLGAASDVLGGRPMLVDTLSQYGIGSIDAIAGWLGLVGVSNGMLGLLDGLAGGVVFAFGYIVVRVAGVGRSIAIAGFTVAVAALVLGLVYPVGALLQHGAIRFGMPMFLLVATAAGLRFAQFATAWRVAAIAIVGISSIWALEAFGYTVLTFAAIVAAEVALNPRGGRLRHALQMGGFALLACVAANAIFTLITLAGSGSIPDWDGYLRTLYEFLAGGIGDLTYDFSPWSPGIAVGAAYLASAAGVCLLITRDRERAVAERTSVVLLAGTTAYGVALFSYLVNRSADHIVPYVSLPVVMAALIWFGMLTRSEVTRKVRMVVLGLALGASALLVSVASSSIDLRFSQSALAYVIPGGPSVTAAIDRLHDMPEIRQGALEAERLLNEYWPDQDESLVITEPDLGIEALSRSGRINVLPLSDPWEAWEGSVLVDLRIGALDETLANLRPGELMLLDGTAMQAFDAYRKDPGLDPLRAAAATGEPSVVPNGLAVLQQYALAEIGKRFRLRVVAQGEDDLYVVRLVPR